MAVKVLTHGAKKLLLSLLNTKISRKEFGLTWNQALETGGVLVGDDIKITIEIQLNPAG